MSKKVALIILDWFGLTNVEPDRNAIKQEKTPNLVNANADATIMQPIEEHRAFLLILSAKIPIGNWTAKAKKLYIRIAIKILGPGFIICVDKWFTNIAHDKSTKKWIRL